MLVVNKQKYTMEVNESKKELHVQIQGFLRTDVVEEYLSDLHAFVESVRKPEYVFVVDATYQSPVPAKVSADIGPTLMYYDSLGFRGVHIVNPKSVIARVQVRNALELIDFPGRMVDSVAELRNL